MVSFSLNFLLFLLAVSLISSAVGVEVKISNVDEFIQFKNNVNGGATYSGTTVLLDSDLDFTGQTFEPIGNSGCFFGVLNGQGHVISNLVMSSSAQYVGLFGYTAGLIVRNVILDSSCSFASSLSGSDDAHIGGLIGYCTSGPAACIIENSVSMASISFTGTTSRYLYLGGIAGEFVASAYEATVKNCANYGDITSSGTCHSSYIGGIAGDSIGSSPSNVPTIQNTLNYGTLAHSGTTSGTLNLGGIAGQYVYMTIENCVSAGKISSTGTAGTSFVGSVVGQAINTMATHYCYVSKELDDHNKYNGFPSGEIVTFDYDSTTFELNDTASIGSYTGTSLIDALNAYPEYVNVEYSHWLLNKNKDAVTFTVNGRASPISMNYQIMVLPSLASEGSMTFDGWYEDTALTTPLTSYETTGDTALYGLYGVILTVTFDMNGGESVSLTSKKVILNDVYGDLPTATWTGHVFDGWFTDATGDEEITKDSTVTNTDSHTLYAHWTVRTKYTLTFEVYGGSKVDSITQDYGTPLNLPNPTKTGHTFAGWFTDSALTTQFSETMMPAADMTLYAKWTAIEYTLTFEVYGGSACTSIKGNYGTSINLPNPTKTGYKFDGWFTDSALTTPFTETTMPAADMTLHAKWTAIEYTLTFEVYGGSECTSIKGNYGTPLNLPNPTKTGYKFGGWFTDSSLTTQFTGTTMPAADMTLYAKWTAIEYTITFEVYGGSECTSIKGNYGTSISLPNPTKTGYTFDGWFTDAAFATQFTETTMPAADMTLHAKWTAIEYTITFEVYGGSECTSIKGDYGTSINLPNPTKTGYTFGGWFTDAALTTPFTETTMPAADMTLYAKWFINQYTVTFDFDNGTVSSVVLDFDTVIAYPEEIVREGFTFGGWDSKPERMPAENITVTAQWTVNQYTITFDFGNGTVSSVVLDFDTVIAYPEEIVREGFAFSEWTPKPERMPAENITVTAQWTLTNPTECVDIMFTKEGMTEDDVEEIIKKFAPKGAKYRAAIIESGPEGTRAGAKFNNKEKAKEFVEAVIASSEAEKSGIKSVGFFPSGCSFSSSLGLSLLVYFVSYLLFF